MMFKPCVPPGTERIKVKVIYTNNTNKISNPLVIKLSISDHYPIVCNFSFKLPKRKPKGQTTITYRSFKNLNQEMFCRDLSPTSFDQVYQHSDPEIAFKILQNIHVKVIDMHAPLKNKRVKQQNLPAWLNAEIISSIKQRDYF